MIRVGVLVTALCLLVGAAHVHGRGKRKKKRKKAKKEEVQPEVAEPVWPSPLDPGAFDAVFRELTFGKERPEFLTTLRVRFKNQLQPVLRATLDARERDSLKEQMERTFSEVVESYVEFAGQQTGYSVSVAAQEFRQNAGEALLKYSYSDTAAYFFFSGNHLW